MSERLFRLILAAMMGCVVVSIACGGGEPASETATETETEMAAPAAMPPEAPAAPPSATAAPRVFFVEPKDGTTVKSPVKLRFGIENFDIAAVPAGEVTMARKGMGHHHVGVDTDCLPPGSIIPKANPWVHHGGGQTEMDMQLTPGPHKLALQIGDDAHTTIDGLCSTVTITVVE